MLRNRMCLVLGIGRGGILIGRADWVGLVRGL
jgi:hypothetical protein